MFYVTLGSREFVQDIVDRSTREFVARLLSAPGAVSKPIPVVTDENGLPVNEFVDYLLDERDKSGQTLLQYALHLARFADFLEASRGIRPLDATHHDIEAFKAHRTTGRAGSVTTNSFRPEASALRGFFKWAKRVGKIQTVPIPQINRSGKDILSTRRTNSEKVSYASQEQIIGLMNAMSKIGARSTKGSPYRNQAAVWLALLTGMRLQEFSMLQLYEIRQTSERGVGVNVEIESTAKNKKRRQVYIPSRAIHELEKYMRLERPHLVASAQISLKQKLDKLFQITDIVNHTRLVAGTWQGVHITYPFRELPVEMRKAAVVVEASGRIEPQSLFISYSSGNAVSSSSWHEAFKRASIVASEDALNTTVSVSPHDLRHTFATNFLKSRIEGLRSQMDSSNSWNAYPAAIYRDPLIELQHILGHSSPGTTMKYLRYVEDVDLGLETMAEEIFGA